MEVLNPKEQKKYLPIGTVILLENEVSQYMIIGYFFEDEKKEKKDYVAVIYPEGFLSLDTLRYFNHGEIAMITILGTVSNRSKRYNDFLNGKIPVYKG